MHSRPWFAVSCLLSPRVFISYFDMAVLFEELWEWFFLTFSDSNKRSSRNSLWNWWESHNFHESPIPSRPSMWHQWTWQRCCWSLRGTLKAPVMMERLWVAERATPAIMIWDFLPKHPFHPVNSGLKLSQSLTGAKRRILGNHEQGSPNWWNATPALFLIKPGATRSWKPLKRGSLAWQDVGKLYQSILPGKGGTGKITVEEEHINVYQSSIFRFKNPLSFGWILTSPQGKFRQMTKVIQQLAFLLEVHPAEKKWDPVEFFVRGKSRKMMKDNL